MTHKFAGARQKFLPLSAFKIPNSLIALETGIVADENYLTIFGEIDTSGLFLFRRRRKSRKETASVAIIAPSCKYLPFISRHFS